MSAARTTGETEARPRHPARVDRVRPVGLHEARAVHALGSAPGALPFRCAAFTCTRWGLGTSQWGQETPIRGAGGG